MSLGPAHAAPHVVAHDRFDAAALAQVAEVTGLTALGRAGATLLPDLPALLGDLFFVFYKAHAALRDDLPPSARFRRRVVAEMSKAPGLAATRTRTLLDPWAAGLAARLVGEHVLRMIKRDDLLLPDELADLHRLTQAEQTLAEAKAQQDALAEMRRDPLAPPPDEDLEDAADEAVDEAQDTVDQAARQAARASSDLPRELRTKLRQGVDAVPDRLRGLDVEVEQFGKGLGTGQRLDAAERLKLGEHLLRSEKLRKLAALVGAFRRLARVQRRRQVPRRGVEPYAVSRGDDIARLLPSELVALRHPLLRRDVQRRFAEKALLQYGLRGDDDRGRGPMIVCLDGSGSMQGAKELWSKAVALTLLEQARRARRAFRVIGFSAHPQPLFVRDLVAPRAGVDGRRPVAMEALVEFAEHFPGGGTDFAPPLEKALETLGEARFRRGDVVLITDGEAQLGDAFVERLLAEKKRLGFRLHAVLVDVASVRAETVARVADEVHRVSALTADAAVSVVGAVR